MPFDGFRVGMLFALAGAIAGIGYDAAAGYEMVWVGGVFGAIAGVLLWRTILWLVVGGAVLCAIVRWLFRDPYRKK